MHMTSGFSDENRPWRQERNRPAKRAVNLSIDAEILATAKAMGVNLSLTLEEELRKIIRAQNTRRFGEDNREAIAAHNKFIDEHGIWSEKLRNW